MQRKRSYCCSYAHGENMEASVKAVDGYNLVTVVKNRNPYIDEFITESRERDLNLTLLKKSKGTSKELIKRLNNQNIIALLVTIEIKELL